MDWQSQQAASWGDLSYKFGGCLTDCTARNVKNDWSCWSAVFDLSLVHLGMTFAEVKECCRLPFMYEVAEQKAVIHGNGQLLQSHFSAVCVTCVFVHVERSRCVKTMKRKQYSESHAILHFIYDIWAHSVSVYYLSPEPPFHASSHQKHLMH